MTTGWAGSTRRATYPKDWHKIKARVRRRSGGRCELITEGQRCLRQARDVDHIDRKGPHTLTNLQHLCIEHHQAKTARESLEARATRKRPQKPHPGLTTSAADSLNPQGATPLPPPDFPRSA